MALDGVFLSKLVTELKAANECHIDKIYQPSRDALALFMRKKGFSKWLYMSLSSGSARVNFTEEKPDTLETPPMFCMLVRKYFSAAKLKDVYQSGLERVLTFCFEAHNEMGDTVDLKIVCELIGNSSNIILLDQNSKVIDAARRSDIENSTRIIAPGAIYKYPAPQNKTDILNESNESAANEILKAKDKSLSEAIVCTFEGISPLFAREVAFKVNCTDIAVRDLSCEKVLKAVEILKDGINGKDGAVIIYSPDNTPMDFCHTDISQYGENYTKKHFCSLSELLDEFYAEKENGVRIKRMSADVQKTVKNALARASKRLNIRKADLEKSKEREHLRIYGELIKANLHRIKNGDTSITVQNFYDENLSEITIKLDPAIPAQKAAAKYFKDYKKACVAEQTLASLIKEDETEIDYLQSVTENLERCKTVKDISLIKEELADQKYIRQNTKSKQKKITVQFDEYTSPQGFKVVVGKNNLQNDYITTKLASKSDTWFHTKGIHGSHVIVFNGGSELSDETIEFAAKLAAKNSKARNSSNVPVDYTPVKFVKKPSGAKPGMVIYTTNKTVFVTAEENI